MIRRTPDITSLLFLCNSERAVLELKMIRKFHYLICGTLESFKRLQYLFKQIQNFQLKVYENALHIRERKIRSKHINFGTVGVSPL